MQRQTYTSLQLKEIFHLEFLRWLARKLKPDYYALKGGVNLRFFYQSLRYSMDMDIDVRVINVSALCDIVMKILRSLSFQESLKPFGINKITLPDMAKAKQAQTTQRFKIHLITAAAEGHFAKIEFSRRGFKGEVTVEPISNAILREYKLAPLVVPHYSADSAIAQKIEALVTRSIIQARDIFDLYILTSQLDYPESKEIKINGAKLMKANDNLLEVGFEQFRDTVISYLSTEDQQVYSSANIWDEIKLRVSNFIEGLQKQ
ncbi:MAG: hypothetical protein COX40_04295 [Candidatus Omnitrophica bacterium CG23_combo_of_CG06-09_8_20_14_all_40_11]|nr:MAG: hypothetical protein COX40_04295 [Candidatus Omnitrophica bacterium CG23_combo_of_CG06-09_8_20_14_all_40_11]